MKLNSFLAVGLTLVMVGLLSTPQPAEAKRFGGGGNVGKQYSVPAQQSQRPTQTQSPAAAPAGQRAPQAGGASRWLGPLAGLAAGGLLASLFFGDAFEGFQIMDFLLIVALVVGGFLLFRLLRRGRAGPLPAGAGAHGGPAPAAAGHAYQRQGVSGLGADRTADTRSGLGGSPQPSVGTDQFPTWFDSAGFLAGSKTHFIRLQAAWDKADFRDIQEYTTPQMFAEIKQEREQLGGDQYTEVVQLQSELISVQRDGDLAVASIQFSGLIREEENGVAEPFREIWHVQHPWATAEGDWFISGIQQG